MSSLKKKLLRYPLWSIPVYMIVFFFVGLQGFQLPEILGLVGITGVATFTTIHDRRERQKNKKAKPGSYNQ